MDEETKRRLREEVGRLFPSAAADIAGWHPGCTEGEVLKEACELLAEKHGLPKAALQAATDQVLAAREQNRFSADLPPPGKQYEDGQLTAARLHMEQLRGALEKTDAALAAVWDDLLTMPYLDDDAQDALPELGDALRTVLRGMSIPPKAHNDGTLTVPVYWQQRAVTLAVLVWERREVPKPLTWNKNWSLRKFMREVGTGEPGSGDGDQPSPLALAFLPWLLLLGVGSPGQPERAWGLLRWAVERRRGRR